jgi:hypothetical protein
MKKLLLSSALAASVLFTGASFAETKVSGSLETTISTLTTKTSGTADNSGPTNIGHEAVLKISNSKALSNGLKMSAGFALDSSEDRASDQFVTLSSGNTSISIGNDVSGVADNVSHEDFTPHVAQDFHSANLGTAMNGVVTTHGSNGIYLKQKTDMITFEGVYSPSRAASNLTGASANTAASGSGYDLAVKGNLGVPGLTIGYGLSEKTADTSTGATKEEGKTYGAKYAMAGFTVGYGTNENTAATTGVKTDVTSYGVSYQVNDQLSVAVNFGEADVSGIATNEDLRSFEVGYDFGGMGVTAGYYQLENDGGASGSDNEVFEIRTVSKF